MDILDQINAALSCGNTYCRNEIGPTAPSPDFCSEACRKVWHQRQAQPLIDYREPLLHGDGVRYTIADQYRPRRLSVPTVGPRYPGVDSDLAAVGRSIAEAGAMVLSLGAAIAFHMNRRRRRN